MPRRRYFSLDEATALIPVMERRFRVLLQLRGQLRLAYLALDRLGAAPGPGRPPPRPEVQTPAELRRAQGVFRGLLEALQDQLQQIEELGVEIKDLDLGVCDFLSQRQGQDIYLSWRYGEKHIGTWHPVE